MNVFPFWRISLTLPTYIYFLGNISMYETGSQLFGCDILCVKMRVQGVILTGPRTNVLLPFMILLLNLYFSHITKKKRGNWRKNQSLMYFLSEYRNENETRGRNRKEDWLWREYEKRICCDSCFFPFKNGRKVFSSFPSLQFPGNQGLGPIYQTLGLSVQ